MKRALETILIATMMVFLAVGCSDDEVDDNSGDGDNKVINGDGPKMDELDPEDICHDVTQGIDEVTSRVMLLEDMSTSMDDGIAGGGGTKWEIAVDAITSMVTTFESNIAFGLDLFPRNAGNGDDASCEVGTSALVDVAFENADTVTGTLSDPQYHNNSTRATPLLLAMGNFLNQSYAPAFMSGEPGGYLVVISDGMDTCGEEGVFNRNGGASAEQLREVTEALLSVQGVQTFVIGFGDGIDPDQLNAIAAAGGTGFDTYFDAQDEEDLNEALSSIGQAVIVSCRYQLGEVSEDADLNNTNIYFDGEPLARGDDCSGEADWTWGNDEMTIIEFCEGACDMLENGQVGELSVIVMCSHDDVVVV